MNLHIILGMCMATICLGAPSEEAVSSISFHRDDVPLSYKFDSVHIYSTENPNKSQTGYKDYKNIQYAPLVPGHREKPARLYTEAIFSKNSTIEKSLNNKYLEPQNFENNYNNPQFITGYNIETPKLTNAEQKTDINSVNKNYVLANQELIKIFPQTNPQNVISVKPNDFSHAKNLYLLSMRRQQGFQMKPIQVLSTRENENIQPNFNTVVKAPRIHLNVARSYNFAREPPKARTNDYQQFINQQQQNFVPRVENTFLQKTLLYPVNKNV